MRVERLGHLLQCILSVLLLTLILQYSCSEAGEWTTGETITAAELNNPTIDSLKLEGATSDANETAIAVVDPTADRTATFPDNTGTVLLDTDIQNQVLSGASPLVFEGSTADAYETTFTITDPTADRIITLPDNTGNIVTFANANTQDVNLVFEGTTADDYETTFTITDPTADRTITVPDATGTIVTTGDTATITATMMAADSVGASELVSNIEIKGWINFNGTGTIAINDSYNVTSITDNGTGNYTISWNVHFASTSYTCSGTSGTTSARQFTTLITYAVGSVVVLTYDESAAGYYDPAVVAVIALGDQ